MLTIENDQCSREKGSNCKKKKEAATEACDRLPLLYFQCVTSACVGLNTHIYKCAHPASRINLTAGALL